MQGCSLLLLLTRKIFPSINFPFQVGVGCSLTDKVSLFHLFLSCSLLVFRFRYENLMKFTHHCRSANDVVLLSTHIYIWRDSLWFCVARWSMHKSFILFFVSRESKRILMMAQFEFWFSAGAAAAAVEGWVLSSENLLHSVPLSSVEILNDKLPRLCHRHEDTTTSSPQSTRERVVANGRKIQI